MITDRDIDAIGDDQVSHPYHELRSFARAIETRTIEECALDLDNYAAELPPAIAQVVLNCSARLLHKLPKEKT
jgi:hypothetical protein